MIQKIFKNGFSNFLRHGGLSITNVFIIFLAVILIVVMYLFNGGMNYAIEEIEDQVDISVFFQAETLTEDINVLKAEIEELEQVKTITFISKEDAYESFVQSHEDDIYIEALRIIDINPFLASIRIITNEPSQYQEVIEFIGEKDIDDMIYKIDDFRREEAIEKIDIISAGVTKLGYGLILFIGFLSILVTFNTIRLTIFSQKKEIEIMKLVGASNWFIRGPYMVQAGICGFLGGLISFLVFYLVLLLTQGSVSNLLMGFDAYNYYLSNIWPLLFIQILAGISLGLISSFIAVTRYLRQK